MKRALALFFLFAAVQVCLRLLVSDSLELDEAEQVLLAQQWAWGYGGQPPLYTWLQAAIFTLCGTNILGLALVKGGLVFAVLAFTYLAVHRVSECEPTALVAAGAWFLLPHFAWEARRDLSHTVLAVAAVAATVFFAVQWRKRPGAAAATGLGLSAALGVLGKYNFLLFLAAFGLAALSVRSVRASLRTWRLLPAVLLFAGICGAHAMWFFTHRELATAGHEKLFAPEAQGRLQATLAGLWSLPEQGVPAALLLVAVCWACAVRRPASNAPRFSARELELLAGRTMLFGVLICVALAVGLQMRFKARWLLPLLAMLPFQCALWLRNRTGEQRVRWLARAGAVAAVLSLVALPAAAPLAPLTGKFTRLNAPYGSLAEQLKENGISPELILAENRLVGGNLKLFFPASRVAVPELPAPEPPAQGQALVVWDATRRAQMPAALAAFANRFSDSDPAAMPVQYVEARQKYSRSRTMRLGFVRVQVPPAET